MRAPTLRGLPPDNVVVLVNGKRRRRSGSLVLWGSSLNEGAQGPDLNMIPGISVEQVELLSDGASAQYGADAIAGVFNLHLRDPPHGALIRARTGEYSQGDGEYVRVGAT